MNGTLASPRRRDDQSTGVICPGTDGQIQSVVDPADSLSLVSPLCDLCPASACVVPGADGQLQSTVSASDVKKPFISTGPDGVSQSTATGDDLQVIAPGKGFDETVCVDAGPDGIAQTSLCGNGITDDEENGFANDEECDDGNTVAGDQCSSICQVEVCGNGIVQGPTEECDDGDIDNSDECVVGCKNARCGDGFLHKGVEECEPPNTTTCDPLCQAIKPPRCGDKVPQAPEACDDGNKSNQDDCLTTCQLAACGDLFVHSKGTPPFEECDDGNTAAGDGCDAGCKKECGNGVIDGACAEGRVGAPCTADSGCDTVPGNGVCHLEQCDPGAAGLCGSTPPACSNVCRFLQCGNGEVECDEECDQGSQNGVPGSPCSGACKLTVVGGSEVDGRTECLAAWTLEQAPGDLKRPKQKCRDGDPCDFDTARNGACTLRVGVCLNRQGVGGCTPGGLKTFELQKLDVTVEEQAAVAENIATAVKNLASQGQADAPDRCSAGLVGKVCSIPDNQECDSAFGAGDGICDVGASVLFAPLLQPVDSGQSGSQLTPCTPPVDVVVQQNARLKLRMVVRREDGKGDKDQLVLACVP